MHVIRSDDFRFCREFVRRGIEFPGDYCLRAHALFTIFAHMLSVAMRNEKVNGERAATAAQLARNEMTGEMASFPLISIFSSRDNYLHRFPQYDDGRRQSADAIDMDIHDTMARS